MDKSFIISDIAQGTVEPINLDNIFTFRKSPSSIYGKPSFTIDFYKEGPQLDVRPISWSYDTEEKRDCDYDLIVSRVAQSINEAM